MSKLMAVLMNGDALIEYDRTKSLDQQQQRYLDKMDQEMDAGIVLAGQRIENPDALQRAQFVALTLAQALQADQEARIAATSSYLAQRLPDLKQVKVTVQNGETNIDLVFDEAYQNQVKVSFMSPSDSGLH